MGAHRPVRADQRRRAPIPQHILRQRQHDRSRPSGGCDLKCLVDEFWDALGHVDLRDPLGERRKHLAEIDLLEGLAVDLVARHLADEHDHRRRVLKGGMDTDRRIARAWASRHQQDPRPPSQLTVCLGHKGGAALLPARHEADLRSVEQRVQHFEIALTGDAEGRVNPMSP